MSTMHVEDPVRAPSPRAETLSLDRRRLIIDEGALFDDAVALCGVVVSGDLQRDQLEQELRQHRSLSEVVRRLLSSGLVSHERWSLHNQLWYRWKIPFGSASLAWWQLYTLALRRAKDPVEARDLFQGWLEAVEGASVEERALVHAACTGLDAERGVVVVRNDVASLACLVHAALRDVPLVGIETEDDLARVERSCPVLFSDVDGARADGSLPALPPLPAPGRGVASLRALCLGRAPRVRELTHEARFLWTDLTPEDRTFILVHLEQDIAALEIVRLSYGNEVIDNNQIAAVIQSCRSMHPDRWSVRELAVATTLWAWKEAGFMIHELNQSEVSLQALRIFFERRAGEYGQLVGWAPPEDLPLPDLVRSFGPLRKQVERTYQRCIYFDGGNFERREFTLRKADIVAQRELPESLRSFMRERFGASMPAGEPIAAWRAYLGELVERSYTPTDLMAALAEWAANADDLPIDIAIFDVPMGRKLERPWELVFEDIFCVTAFREGWDPKAANLPLGPVGVRNAIGQRMRYNAVKKAQNYALIKRTTPQSFLLPDISVAEDANHGGHNASGVRHACRVPIAVHYQGSEWKGIADVRLSRTDYSDENRFREADLLVATRYGAWSKAIADETYARGLLFDARYCVNLDDGRDVVARLGHARKGGDKR